MQGDLQRPGSALCDPSVTANSGKFFEHQTPHVSRKSDSPRRRRHEGEDPENILGRGQIGRQAKLALLENIPHASRKQAMATTAIRNGANGIKSWSSKIQRSP